MKKVLVLSGGFSAEREVSLISGKGAAAALKKCGYNVVEHDLTSTAGLFNMLKTERPDVIFNALHGNWGEDGTIQAFFDLLQIPYTHSGMAASLLGMNKPLTKQICQENNIPTAAGEVMTYAEYRQNGTSISYPYVVKPCQDGSSVGVFIIQKPEDIAQVIYDDAQCKILIEKYISGRELTVAVLDNKACAVTELKPHTAFYDYHAKYTSGITHHILPAEISASAAAAAMKYAEKIHRLLGCNTISRSDFRYNETDGVVFLEINTNPGLTPLSLVPEQAKYIGVSYEQLCTKLVENAQCRKIR